MIEYLSGGTLMQQKPFLNQLVIAWITIGLFTGVYWNIITKISYNNIKQLITVGQAACH